MSDVGDLAREFLSDHAPLRADADPKLYTRFAAELGLASLPVEASWVEVCDVLTETGRVLLRSPYLSTVVATTILHERGFAFAELTAGTRTAALALDGLDHVVDAEGADLLLVGTPEGLDVLEDYELEPLTPLDVTRPQARVRGGTRTLIGGPGAVDHARDLLHLGLAAEAVGASRKVLELTVQHLKVREQFGRPLGSFQALRHRVADLTVALEAATSTVWFAARHPFELPVAAPLALATASDAACLIAGEAIQLHGGIGFTWEHDLHLYLKRAWTTAVLHGNGAALRRLAFERSRA